MKIYKLLETVLTKYEGENNFILSSHICKQFDLGTSFETVSEKFNRELDFNYNKYNNYGNMIDYGSIKILKQTDKEFIFKYIEEDGYTRVCILQIVETEINI